MREQDAEEPVQVRQAHGHGGAEHQFQGTERATGSAAAGTGCPRRDRLALFTGRVYQSATRGLLNNPSVPC